MAAYVCPAHMGKRDADAKHPPTTEDGDHKPVDMLGACDDDVDLEGLKGLLKDAELACGTLMRTISVLDRHARSPPQSRLLGANGSKDVLHPRTHLLPEFLRPDTQTFYAKNIKGLRERISGLLGMLPDETAFTGPDPSEAAASSAPPKKSGKSMARACPEDVDVGGNQGLCVKAVVLPETCRTEEQVLRAIRGPALCYVPAWDHFAVRLGRHLLHGNIGRIYPPGTRFPVGVKTCAKRKCTDPSCTYYHNPARLCGSNSSSDEACRPLPLHIRSHIADGFVYHSRSEAPRRPVPYGGRHFGDVSALALDMISLRKEEVERFLDQVAHDLVCAAVILENWNEGHGHM